MHSAPNTGSSPLMCAPPCCTPPSPLHFKPNSGSPPPPRFFSPLSFTLAQGELSNRHVVVSCLNFVVLPCRQASFDFLDQRPNYRKYLDSHIYSRHQSFRYTCRHTLTQPRPDPLSPDLPTRTRTQTPLDLNTPPTPLLPTMQTPCLCLQAVDRCTPAAPQLQATHRPRPARSLRHPSTVQGCRGGYRWQLRCAAAELPPPAECGAQAVCQQHRHGPQALLCCQPANGGALQRPSAPPYLHPKVINTNSLNIMHVVVIITDLQTQC